VLTLFFYIFEVDMRIKHIGCIIGALLFALLLVACGPEPAQLVPQGSPPGTQAESVTPPGASESPGAHSPETEDTQKPVDTPGQSSSDVAGSSDTAASGQETGTQNAPQGDVQHSAALLTLDFTRDLTVHFIDVGQADSILIQLPNGQTMLIDGGESRDANNIMSYMRSKGVTTIDYLVATHPHADHIGGLPTIIDAMDIRSIYMPRVSHTTQTFERLLTSIQNKGLQIDTARAGVSILSSPGLQIDIVAPIRDNYSDLNDHSAVIKITYGSTSFLFTGDAESHSEGHITADVSTDVSADVLKVSHHGSRTSTTDAFLRRVAPTYAVISVGSGNTYGHPTDEVLARLDSAGVSVFRTDLQGTIVFTSDGENISKE